MGNRINLSWKVRLLGVSILKGIHLDDDGLKVQRIIGNPEEPLPLRLKRSLLKILVSYPLAKIIMPPIDNANLGVC